MRNKTFKFLLYTLVLCTSSYVFIAVTINYSVRLVERFVEKRDGDFYKRDRYDVDCDLIFEGDNHEINKTETLLNQVRNQTVLTDANFTFTIDHCAQFRRIREYDRHPVNQIELDFPLAYSIMIYNFTEQFERLLNTIYRPHNVYCIHVDAKSPPEFHKAIKSIVQCFDNVFIASKLERIVYAGYSRLQADLNCMSDLLDANYARIDPTKKQVKWKYLFNLAGTEFPLKTNYEIVRIMQLYNGGNDIETIEKYDNARFNVTWIETIDRGMIKNSSILKSPPPHNFTLVKGLAYGGFSYQFVDFMINNNYSRDLLVWFRDTYSPDEAYWATLHHNTQFNPPGGYRDSWVHREKVNTTSRFVSWRNEFYGCRGKWVHGVCIFSFRDLPLLLTRHELFVNKFHLDYNPIVYQCMEDWIEKKVISKPLIRVKDYCKHPVVSFYNKNNTYCD